MKTKIFLFPLSCFFFLLNQTFSQCTSDLTITDTDLPGEIFPLDLTFKQGTPVNLILTILPPPTAVQGSLTFNLKRIVLKSIGNKPSWMNYVSDAPTVTSGGGSGYEFMVGQKYCMVLSGTPPEGSFLGTDSMAVIVDAYQSPTGFILATNSNGGYIRFTVCALNDNSCWPQKVINPAELVFKEGVTFSDTLSYVPSSQLDYSGSFYNLSKVVIREITGLPSWVTYTINAPAVTTGTITPVTGYEMLVGNRYTIIFSGTPDASFVGTSNMIFKLDPYLHNGNLITENITGEQISYKVCVAADSSCYPSGIADLKAASFRLLTYNPVISENVADIKFYCDSNKPVSLKVFDILGKQVYSSTMQAVYGVNNFQFPYNKQNQGTYIFTVSDNNSALTGKLFKIQGK